MSALDLSPSEVRHVRRLLSVDDQVSEEGRWRAALLAVSDLVPCDLIGVGVADATGCLERVLDLPSCEVWEPDPRVCDGPLPTGIQHVAAFPQDDEDLLLIRALGIRDTLRIGFPLGQGRVVQMYLDRKRSCFEPRELVLLSMLEPALGRMLRPSVCAVRLRTLSDAERRVLGLVAEGGSNQDVAVQLSVSEATVRKHLEHAYRKLGVANRTAAAALVHDSAGS
jgi:DNA-binding CsgD family transcriptional regulator